LGSFKEETAMLVLTRKPGEKLRLGWNITITVLEVKGNKVRIGIEAPDDVAIMRSELEVGSEPSKISATAIP
jgi:carbon storage regulator